jgi:DNA polymerase III sliding clamp (beta) subunit (PCNA family)
MIAETYSTVGRSLPLYAIIESCRRNGVEAYTYLNEVLTRLPSMTNWHNIDIVANTPEVGEAKESLAVMYQGREYSIAFNPEFLMAPLRNLSEEEIYLDLIDELSPGVIKIAGPFLYVLMPVRL